MHFGIIAQGSRGDVQPMIALGLSLKKNGHKVTLLAPENFEDFVTSFHIDFIPLVGDIEKIAKSSKAKEILSSGNVIRFLFYYNKITYDITEKANQYIYENCSQFDGIIGGSLSTTIIHSIAEKLNKKYVLVFPSMPVIPTKKFPIPIIYTKIPSFLNKFSYNLTYFLWLLQKKQTNNFRRKIDLAPFKAWKNLASENALIFFTLSEVLLTRPDDWPDNVHITNAFRLPKENLKNHPIDTTPTKLQDWIKSGVAPIYIGFGSIPIPDTKRFKTILTSILQDDTKRIILGLGWSTLNDLPIHKNLYVVHYVNHDWLLPQCKLAIIHGGIGTVHAALRAGIPLIIASIIADQPYHGRLITKNKLGVHIPFSKLTTKAILKAINTLQNPEYINNTKNIAQQLNKENGVEIAVKKIISHFS